MALINLRLISLLLVIASIQCNEVYAKTRNIKFRREKINIDKDYSIWAEAGTLQVPEDRKTNRQEKITLKVIKLKSTSSHPGSPIVYLAGGPGVSGISMLKTERLIIFEALRAFGDVIIFDQRGTGHTMPTMTSNTPLNLPLDKPIDHPESIDAFYNSMKAMLVQLKNKNIDINAYNTIENAADVNDLRLALGVDKLNLWGYSYGSHLALAVIKEYGRFVEKAILSGINGLNQRFRLPTDINQVIEEMDHLIDQNPPLRTQIPSLKALIKQELEKLQNNPVTTTIEVNNKPTSVTIGRTDVEVLIALNLGSISFIREFPQLFYQMSQNNYSAMTHYVYKYIKTRPIGTPMSYSMHYASGFTADRLAVITNTQQEGIIRNAINFPFLTHEMQQLWAVPDLGDSFRNFFSSEVPVLLLSGNLDGRTSVSDAVEVGKQFSNKTHIVFKNASHDLLAPQIIPVIENFMGNKRQNDTTYTVSGFDFYAPNSQQIIQKSTAILFAGGMTGIEKFRQYYTQQVLTPDTYVTPTQILPTVYQLFKLNKPELALAALKINQELFKTENWQIIMAIGEAYSLMDKKEEALQYFNQSLELNPLNFEAYKKIKSHVAGTPE